MNKRECFRYVGVIVGIIILKPFLLTRPVWAFAIPEIFVVVTLLCGIILQPETKGKALMDRLIEGHFGRLENEIPKAVMRSVLFSVSPKQVSDALRERTWALMASVHKSQTWSAYRRP